MCRQPSPRTGVPLSVLLTPEAANCSPADSVPAVHRPASSERRVTGSTPLRRLAGSLRGRLYLLVLPPQVVSALGPRLAHQRRGERVRDAEHLLWMVRYGYRQGTLPPCGWWYEEI